MSSFVIVFFWGNFTDGVGRQYIGEIGKTDNGNVIVTSHIHDGVRSFPLDVELYQKAENFPLAQNDPQFSLLRILAKKNLKLLFV